MCKANEKIKIEAVSRERKEIDRDETSYLSQDFARQARNFHKTFKKYAATPLVNLKALAEEFGVKSIFVKDESHRFGLNAFKVLGSTFAIGKLLSEKIGIDCEKITFEELKNRASKEKITFVTATDGNHGAGLAWAAKQLEQKAVVYLPKGTEQIRVDSIRSLDAKVEVTDFNYDSTVEYAREMAEKNEWQLVQDTALEGYTKVPKWIMQGYLTIIDEAIEQIEKFRVEKPTHLFLQAGVGSMAGSLLGYCVNRFGDEYPITVIIEPENANCHYKSALINDGKPHRVKGELKTIMVGLACGMPNPVSWEILRDYADMFISCKDSISARGMRIYANPLKDDKKIVSGESGAVSLGFLSVILQYKEFENIRNRLNLTKSSSVLLISTEGDTDPINYRNIIWNGKESMPC